MKNLTHGILGLTFLITHSFAQAQKLPNIQKNGVKLPATTKVDGRSTEWGSDIQAYNRSTNIFYTIANDNDKLYLLIKANDPLIAKKILGGGVSLLLNRSNKKDSQNDIVITAPLLKRSGQFALLTQLTELSFWQTDSTKNVSKIDSIVNNVNQRALTELKEIKVIGIKDIADSLISVYNTEGIRAALGFDRKGTFSYELSVPLKLLGLTNAAETFNYNIKLNGATSVYTSVQRNSPDGPVTVVSMPRNMGVNSSTAFQVLNYPTDVWGEYTLVK